MNMKSFMPTKHIRWGDSDKYFGPITYARDNRYKFFGIILGSGDDDYKGCRIRFSGFGHTLIIGLPPIIKPWRKKVIATSWDEATVKRMGRNWYWDAHEREYGFSCFNGHMSLHLGRQTHDSQTEQRWGCFLPWTQWRHVRHSFYGINGEHFWDEPQPYTRLGTPEDKLNEEKIAACPTMSFNFSDYDGEKLTAKTRIEERQWLFGTGYFKWLTIFSRPKISRSLDVRFSGETGKRKGSWKGGTLGHGIDMLSGELHEAAFKRYCTEHEMIFEGKAL